jgi:ribosomal protein S27AE
MADVASYCTYCGAKIEPSSKFCSNCGKATSIAAAQETTASAAGGGGGGIVKDVGGGRVAGIAEKRALAACIYCLFFFGL